MDHTTVTITAGEGLNYSVGGANISASSTIDLDINGLTSASAATTTDSDVLAIYDVAGSPGHKKILVSELRTLMQSGIDLNLGIDADTGDVGDVATSSTLIFTGAANQITTDFNNSTDTVTISIATNPTLPGNVTITGDLTVNGTTTTIDTDTLRVEDPLISMGRLNTATDTVDLGIYWTYGVPTTNYGGIYRDTSDTNKAITFFEGGTAEPTTTVTGGTLADVKFGTVRSGTWLGNAIADAQIASSATWNAKQDALTFGIANTNSVVIDSVDVGSGEFARFTASGLEGLTASEMRTALNVDVAGTDNSTPVTLAGTYDYLTLSGQQITLNQINLTTDVTDILPRGNGGLGISTAPGNGQVLLGTTGNAWVVGSIGAGNTTGTNAEGIALAWTTGAGTLSVAAKYATTTLSGVVSLATAAEAIAETNTAYVLTPSTLASWANQSNKTVTRKYVGSITGNNSTSTFTLTHNLGTPAIAVFVYDNWDNVGYQVFPDIDVDKGTPWNTVDIIFSVAPDTGQNYEVIVIG